MLRTFYEKLTKKFRNTFEKPNDRTGALKRGQFGIFQHPSCCKISKKIRGDHLVQSKNFEKVCRKVKNTIAKGTSLGCFRGSGRRFVLDEVLTFRVMSRTSVVQVVIFRPYFIWAMKIFESNVFFLQNLPRINFTETKFNFMGVTHRIQLT